jgi:hypothetical protein
MLRAAGIRDDHIRSLAMRLRKDLLSSDEFKRELAALSKIEKAVLVEFLADLASGPVEWNASAGGFDSPPNPPSAVNADEDSAGMAV